MSRKPLEAIVCFSKQVAALPRNFEVSGIDFLSRMQEKLHARLPPKFEQLSSNPDNSCVMGLLMTNIP